MVIYADVAVVTFLLGGVLGDTTTVVAVVEGLRFGESFFNFGVISGGSGDCFRCKNPRTTA